MINIAICDDEVFYIEKIKNGMEKFFAQKRMDDYVIDTYNSGEELCSNRKRLEEYQIVFLDVNMQQMDGLEAARRIREVNKDAYLVFVTAYVDYAVEGYKVDAIRFLIKDSLEATLPECMETILERIRYKEAKEVFAFAEGSREVSVYQIRYIESQRHKMIFYIGGEKEEEFTMYGKMNEMEERLKQYGFFRIHKSFLVNMKEIVQVANYRAVLRSGEKLPIPREKFRQVKEEYFRMMGEI